MKLLALILATAAFAAAPDFKQADFLYLHRDAPGNLQRCIAMLQREVGAPDEDAEWRLGRALIAQSEGKGKDQKLALLADAAKHLERAVGLKPDDSRAHYWRAQEMGAENSIRRTLGLARAMKKELETAIHLNGGNAAAHQTYGELLRQLPVVFGGSKKKAVGELEGAVGLAPNDPGRWVSLAQAYLDVDNKPAARAAAQRALAVTQPEDPASAADDRKAAQRLLDSLK